MKSIKFLIVVVLVLLSVNSARSEFETLVKDGEKVICSVPVPPVLSGEIKYAIARKNFGFVKDTQSGAEYFFIYKDFLKQNPGYKGNGEDLGKTRVSFELIQSSKGIIAVNVSII